MALSLVKELSVSTATAMTSPRASPAQAGPVPLARPDDNKVSVRLTAADTANAAGDTQAPNSSSKGVEGETRRKNVATQENRLRKTKNADLQEDELEMDVSRMHPMHLSGMTEDQAVAAFMGWNPTTASYNTGAGNQVPPAATVRDLHFPYAGPPAHLHERDETRISAYAMLEFDDGQFYMNTYSVILGRDLAAARAAMRRDAERGGREVEGFTEEMDRPVHIKGERSGYTRSLISESAGILREGNDSDSDERARRRRHRRHSKKSKSTGSSSQRVSRRNSLALQSGKADSQSQPQVRRYAPDTVRAAPVDPATLRPSPYDCPLVGIHPPAATPASGFKAISRRHVKIAYNSKKNLFEAEIVGRNGAFIDEVFYYHSDVVSLKSGSVLQIGGVVVRFTLPEVAIGETGAENHIEYEDGTTTDRYSEGDKEMSFDIEENLREDARIEGISNEESEEEEESEQEEECDDMEESEEEDVDNVERIGDVEDNGGDDENEEDEEEEGEEDKGGHGIEKVREPSPQPQKRRGPGRPPKNGVMSQREQALAKREERMKATKRGPKPKTSQTPPRPPSQPQQPPIKNKVGRPRKHPIPDTPIKTEKRKYTKRKPKDPDAMAKRNGSGDDNGAAKEKKEKKAFKPPRSPTPTFKEEDLTPEQLAKPNANYVALIFEALSNCPTGMMSLPQIYRAIQRRYPYFVLRCSTTGWQSSVRHNLSQHHAFRKVERDGKGWMWAIVEGATIEKEKKRRPTPPSLQTPPGPHQPIYRAMPTSQHMSQGPPGMMGPPLGYPINANIPAYLRPGQPQQSVSQLMNCYFPPGSHLPINGQNQTKFPGQPAGASSVSYSSPYAPTHNPDTTFAQKSTKSSDSNIQGSGPNPGILRQPHSNSPQQIPLNDSISRAIDTFKTALVTQLSGKSSNAESVVASAINRVLGNTAQNITPADPQEEKIMTAFRGMLMKIPGVNFLNQSLPQQSVPQQPLIALSSQSAPIENKPTAIPNATKSPLPVTPISRPSFSGHSQNRANNAHTPVPRPSMATQKPRTNLDTSSNGLARSGGTVSSPMQSTNGENVPKETLNQNGKRQVDRSEDDNERNFKSFVGPPLKASFCSEI